MSRPTQVAAGTLRHRVVIQQLTETPRDGFGAPARAWSAFATRWASVEPLTGREIFEAQQTYPRVDYRIRLRHTEGITSKMRVDFNGRFFDIVGVWVLQERRVETHLMCIASGLEAA